ncbi:chromatin remodeling complex subunit [Mycena floridula]|nr:chromatin remodeling complex subunit [Mycena floridula]
MDLDEQVTHVPQTPLPTSSAVISTEESYDLHRRRRSPIIIDNGSTHLRWGFSGWNAPNYGPNIISKFKERRTNRPLLLFGDALDSESGARTLGRTAWEGDVLLNFDALENALDFAFVQLGIDTPTIDHPVIMTERLCSPLHSRALTSELMFELYNVPNLTYCVDAVMSFYQNQGPSMHKTGFNGDGLVVSFNTASTSVIPILNGKGILSHSKRIPWGPSQASDYMLKLIQLKYPNFPTRVTSMQSTWMLQEFCSFAEDYPALIKTLRDPLNLRAAQRIVQFPFSLPTGEEKTQEELDRMLEKRKEQGRKLQEMAAKMREDKLVQKESDLQNLLSLRESRAYDGKKEWLNKLYEEGFNDEGELDETIKKLEGDVKKAKKKDREEGDDVSEEPPSFPLVDVPDADLDEDGLREKRKQKLMKAGFEARVRARKEKEREKEEREREERQEEEERDMNLTEWSRKKRTEHEALMNRIKERARRKAALSDRKSSAAQARMKNIASLAADERIGKKKTSKKVPGEDTFGADDADWAIYRKINTAVPSSDEEEDLNQLHMVEQKLLAHDPSFTRQHTHASIASQRSALLTAFRPSYEDGDVEGSTRIHLSTERWRVCEAWFSPNMAGVDSAGLGEVIQNILSRFSEEEKGKLVKNVFLTGGAAELPGLVPRLHAAMRPNLAPELPIDIQTASSPTLDAWKGMEAFSRSREFSSGSTGMTREEYDEMGPERVKAWWGGNSNNSFGGET